MENSGDNLDVGGVNMKMNKITQFLKQNVFYISMGVVIIGALVAVLLLPSGGNVQPDTNSPNKQVAGKVSDDYEGEKVIVNDEMPTEEEMTSGDETNISDEESLQSEDIQDEAKVEEQSTTDENVETTPTPSVNVIPETEDAALNDSSVEENLAINDEQVSTFVTPVVGGEIVVDYSEQPKLSKTLGDYRTMAGRCYKADKGSNFYAVKAGVVETINTDATAIDGWNLPNVGQTIVLNLNDGYKIAYGFSDGIKNPELNVGDVVNAGDVLGTLGGPAREFNVEEGNMYIQLMYDNNVVDPAEFFQVVEK